jgi:hypothetical protein
MIDEILILAAAPVGVFRLIKHHFCFLKVEHLVGHHSTLNKSNPTMQLGGRPFPRVLFDPFTHPQEMVRMKGLWQISIGLSGLLNQSFALFRHCHD